MLRRLFFIFGAVGLTLGAIVFLLPIVLPANTIKSQVEKLVEDNSGWKIRFRGDVSMSLVPSVRLTAEDIEVSPPNHTPILNAEEARFSVGLSALFSGAVDIQEIFFGKPDILIETGEDGNPIWLEPASAASEPQAHPSGDTDNGSLNAFIEKLRLQKFTIEDARVRYGKSGEVPLEIENITLSASLPDPQGALTLDGSAVFAGDLIVLSGEIPTFSNVLATNSGLLEATASFKGAAVQAKGRFASKGEPLLNADFSLSADDLSRLAGEETLAPGTLSATGTLVVNQSDITLALPKGTFYDTNLTADFHVQTGGEIPLITGAIALGDLNLDTLKPPTSNTPPKTENSQQPAPPPDLSALASFDADIRFVAAQLRIEDHEIKNLKGSFSLSDGVADVLIDQVAALGGSAALSISADTKLSPLTTYGSLKAENLSVPTLLTVAGQNALVKQVKGRLGADLVFGFQGVDTNDIVNSVNARGSVSFKDGSYIGLGLAEALNDPSADRAEAINITTTLDGFSKPVDVSGSARWRGETLSFSANSDLGSLIAGQKAATRANISFSKAEASFTGDVAPTLPAAGRIEIKGRSLRNLAGWLGSELPPGEGYGAFDIRTDFSAAPTKVSLSKLSLNLDDLKGSGNATVLLGTKPDITATISFDLLDVNPYIATPVEGGGSESPAQNGSEWSQEPIDFSFTQSMNLNLTARVKTLKAQGLSVGPLALKTIIKDGRLISDLTEMGFYGGTATAKVDLDANAASPVIKAELRSTNVDAYPFLKDAAAFEHIEGTLNLTTNVTGSGRSQAALVSSLNGISNFAFADGAIRGINIAKSMRSLTSGALSGWNNSEAEKTDFSSFDASFDIKNGVATNTDLNLVGPLVRVTGEGSLGMPAQSIDYRVNPKIVPTLQGQGGKKDLTGFAVPIRIKGPWASPKIYPDIDGFLQNPAAGLAQLQSLGGGFAAIAASNPASLVSSLASDPKTAAVGAVGKALKSKTGVDVGSLLQGGNASKKGGLAAAAGAVGSLLGGGNQPAEVQPLQQGEIPVPRARPKPSNAVTSVVEQIVKPTNDGQAALPVQVPKDAKKALQGLGGLLGGR